MRNVLLWLALFLPSLFAGGELFMRSDYNQQHVLGAYPVNSTRLNDIPRQYMGAFDMTYPADVPPGKTRILIIGDSLTWAAGVHPSDRFADVLAAAHPELEVVVLAPPGNNTPMEVDLWKQYGRDVGASIVIVAVGYLDNDLGLVPKLAPAPDYLRRVLPNSQLAALFDHTIRPPQEGNRFWEINSDADTSRLWRRILRDFAADIRAHGATPYALILAQPFDEHDDAPAKRLYAQYELYAMGAGFETVNFARVYEDYYGDLLSVPERWASPNDPHFNEETHALLAGWLWGLLKYE